MEIISERDTLTLEAIRDHFVKTGFSMSLAEAAEALGMSKGSVIADSFKRLEAAGLLVYSENRKQCIPTDWRELITLAVSYELQEAKTTIETMKSDAYRLEQVRAQNRERQAQFYKRKKETRNAKKSK